MAAHPIQSAVGNYDGGASAQLMMPNPPRQKTALEPANSDPQPLKRLLMERARPRDRDSPGLNYGIVKQVTLPAPAGINLVETIRCFQVIERQIGGRANAILQFAMPAAADVESDTVYSLAWTASMMLGRQVLLIDAGCNTANLSHPAPVTAPRSGREIVSHITSHGHVQKGGVLTDLLTGETALEEVIAKEYRSDLFVASLLDDSSNGYGLPSARDLSALLGHLRPHFDLVMITAGAVLDGPLPTMLSGMVDGSVMVLQAGGSRTASARRAIDAIQSGGAPILGAILGRHRNYLPSWLRRA